MGYPLRLSDMLGTAVSAPLEFGTVAMGRG